MDAPPPLIPRTNDAYHLKLLAVFHYVFGGLAVLGLGFLALHYGLFSLIANNPEALKNQNKGGPSPQEVFAIFKLIYLVMGVPLSTTAVLNFISARCIQLRRARTFSLAVGCFDCLCIPFGTVLGVFTLIVLLRDSAKRLYPTVRTSA